MRLGRDPKSKSSSTKTLGALGYHNSNKQWLSGLFLLWFPSFSAWLKGKWAKCVALITQSVWGGAQLKKNEPLTKLLCITALPCSAFPPPSIHSHPISPPRSLSSLPRLPIILTSRMFCIAGAADIRIMSRTRKQEGGIQCSSEETSSSDALL